ncbi:nuclear speckle splicing regulatory protein 1 [Protopterus annectens]|uniref:nuclear speckle splicing regulatory protein 1 n=1 Tax=Protopterus annectens TaxID=7888 RepID=UPI001CFB5A08|nr:nuclear speckle splicing regulatory protein 1 [Protopterus annectens]
MAAPGKQYGLILPKKIQQRPVLLKKPSVFADDSDEEVSVAKSLQKEEIKKKLMKQTKLEMHKALEEDATVYEYDSIYDEIQQKKAEDSSRLLAGQDKKPKYIASLMKAVEIRKKEQEKRMEKKIQKERESEDGQFDDKEAFVTSAYKAKLQERVEEEERERKEAVLEAALDVTKQRDLSGFYRHLLNQTVGEEKTPECSLRGAGVKEKESSVCSAEVFSSDNKEKLKNEKNRSETPEPALENLDADSDFEIDSDDEEEQSKSKKKLCSKDRGNEEHSDGSEADTNKHGTQKQASSRGSSSDDQRDHLQRDNQKAAELKNEQDSSLRNKESSGYKDKHKAEKYKDSEYERGTDTYKSSRDRERESRQRERDYEIKDKNKDEQENRSKDKEKKYKEHRREKEREERYMDKRLERQAEDKHDKYSERGQEKSRSSLTDGRTQEKNREEKPEENEKRNNDSLRRDSKSATTEKERHKDSTRPSEKEKHRDSVGSSELKHKVAPEKEDEDVSSGSTKSQPSKFSKRSTEETVMTARERFFARQLSRLANKSYIEKEED